MAQTQWNQQRLIYTAEEAAASLGGQPYIAHVCYSDWTDGDHSTLMHCHQDIAEILLILKGHGHYTVDLRRFQVGAGDVILCNSGALHDEFPQAGEPYRTLCIGIGDLALTGLPPGSFLESCFSPMFHRPEQFGDLQADILSDRPLCGRAGERVRDPVSVFDAGCTGTGQKDGPWAAGPCGGP